MDSRAVDCTKRTAWTSAFASVSSTTGLTSTACERVSSPGEHLGDDLRSHRVADQDRVVETVVIEHTLHLIGEELRGRMLAGGRNTPETGRSRAYTSPSSASRGARNSKYEEATPIPATSTNDRPVSAPVETRVTRVRAVPRRNVSTCTSAGRESSAIRPGCPSRLSALSIPVLVSRNAHSLGP